VGFLVEPSMQSLRHSCQASNAEDCSLRNGCHASNVEDCSLRQRVSWLGRRSSGAPEKVSPRGAHKPRGHPTDISGFAPGNGANQFAGTPLNLAGPHLGLTR
jgi:hypothetical protein